MAIRSHGAQLGQSCHVCSHHVFLELELPRSGRWELQLAWSAHANRAARVPVRIEAAGEVLLELELDQRQPAPLDGLWSSLAELEQDVGSVFVVVESARSGGYVVVDAARALLLD